MGKDFSELALRLMNAKNSEEVNKVLDEIQVALDEFEFPGDWSTSLAKSLKDGVKKVKMHDETREVIGYCLKTLQARIKAGQ